MEHYRKEDFWQRHVGEFLKNKLWELGMTQEEFAEQVFAEPRTVSRWINNGVNQISNVVKIAQVLGVSVEDIFRVEEDVLPFYVQYGNRVRPDNLCPVVSGFFMRQYSHRVNRAHRTV